MFFKRLRLNTPLLSFVLLSGLAHAPFVRAQVAVSHPPATPAEEVDLSEDDPENDPSPGEHLMLDKVIHQKGLLLHGVSHELTQNVSKGLSNDTFKALLPWVPYTGRKAKNFTYADAVNDETLFTFLKIHEHRYTPAKEFGPSLINTDEEFAGISDILYGYCWGFATLNRYFSVLAFFDPSLPRQSVSFYKGLIDQVVRGEATLFPGIANFRELSLIPELELYLKLNVMELWHSRAAKSSNLKILKKASKETSNDKVDDTVDELEARLKRGETPKLIFSSLVPSHKVFGFNPDIHVVLPYKIEHLAGQHTRIYIWDNNFYTETLQRSPKFIEVMPDREIHYAPWGDSDGEGGIVSRIRIAPESDRETLLMMLSLKKFCSEVGSEKYCIPHSVY